MIMMKALEMAVLIGNGGDGGGDSDVIDGECMICKLPSSTHEY